MTSSEVAITNLLYRYAELIDHGLIDELADELFGHAQFILAPDAPTIDGPAMGRLLKKLVIVHEDGTPMTRHVITNAIVHVDERAGTATCRSYYTVFQHLSPIVQGRYDDRFARIEGEWCFTQRDYSMMDITGDTSEHLRPLA